MAAFSKLNWYRYLKKKYNRRDDNNNNYYYYNAWKRDKEQCQIIKFLTSSSLKSISSSEGTLIMTSPTIHPTNSHCPLHHNSSITSYHLQWPPRYQAEKNGNVEDRNFKEKKNRLIWSFRLPLVRAKIKMISNKTHFPPPFPKSPNGPIKMLRHFYIHPPFSF